MKQFIKNITLFLIITIVIGEITVRLTHAVSDIPQRTIDEFGIQKYKPNQKGYWKGGNHTWLINKLGWPGELPEQFDNLVMIIGDSYIENFMNPNECHQSEFLKKNISNFNFMEAGRSGISFIEALEISKQIDSLKPLQTLIYVNDHDFYESITEVRPMADITQLSIKNNIINYGQLKAPTSKKILYNFKLLYYFYNRFPLNAVNNEETQPNKINESEKNGLKFETEISQLLQYTKRNYNLSDKTLVFHPNSNQLIIEKAKEAGFNVVLLDSKSDATWSFEYDSHWTCYGHEKAAKQVETYLKLKQFKSSQPLN